MGKSNIKGQSKRAELVWGIITLGYRKHTEKTLLRWNIAKLTALVAELREADCPQVMVDRSPVEHIEQSVDTSCVASVLATEPLPVAEHAEALPVATIAPPIPTDAEILRAGRAQWAANQPVAAPVKASWSWGSIMEAVASTAIVAVLTMAVVAGVCVAPVLAQLVR